MRRLLMLAMQRLRKASGVQNMDVMLRRALTLNRDWEYGQSNLKQLLDDDLYRLEIFDAERKYALNARDGFEHYLKLANKGSAFSMDKVAQCYEEGRGAPCDPDEALAWLRRGFEAGSTYALLNYGRALIARRDLPRAESVFKNGAADGWPPAEVWFALVKVMRDDDAASWRLARPMLEKGSARGSPAARLMLAYGAARGRFGLGEALRGVKDLVRFSDEADEAFPFAP